MQYEDNATEIVFNLSSVIAELEGKGITKDRMLFKVNLNSFAAGYDPSENLTPDTQNQIKRLIPKKMTQYGGEIAAVAEITVIDAEENATGEIYSYPVTLVFTAQPRDAATENEVIVNISAAEEKARGYAEDAERFSADAEQSASDAKGYAEELKGAFDRFDEFETALNNKADKSEVEEALENKADKSELSEAVENLKTLKMDKVMGSEGQYASFDGISPKINPTSPDTAPTQNSNKLITSGAVYSALGKKLDIMQGFTIQYLGFNHNLDYLGLVQADVEPTKNSEKLITSGAVYTAVGNIESALDSIIAMQNELIGGDAE
jgi:hypothetical protein